MHESQHSRLLISPNALQVDRTTLLELAIQAENQKLVSLLLASPDIDLSMHLTRVLEALCNEDFSNLILEETAISLLKQGARLGLDKAEEMLSDIVCCCPNEELTNLIVDPFFNFLFLTSQFKIVDPKFKIAILTSLA